jgi:hypothetical protein
MQGFTFIFHTAFKVACWFLLIADRQQPVSDVIVVVKKTLRYSNVFFYNPLCPNSVNWNIIMESGIKPGDGF